MLYVTFGFIQKWNDVLDSELQVTGLFRRTSPSGGSLHPTDGYLLVKNVTGLKSGIYFYDSQNHHLIYQNSLPDDFLFSQYLIGQFWADKLPFGVFCVSDFSMIWSKYPDARALRVGFMDVGHLSQTFLLSATALGLNTWLTGAFEDNKVHQLLNLPFDYHAPLLFLGAGKGNNNPIPSVFERMEGQTC